MHIARIGSRPELECARRENYAGSNGDRDLGLHSGATNGRPDPALVYEGNGAAAATAPASWYTPVDRYRVRQAAQTADIAQSLQRVSPGIDRTIAKHRVSGSVSGSVQ